MARRVRSRLFDDEPDPLIPGPPSEAKPAWTRNGSFLVYRRLLQDVGLFWRTMRDEEAARLAALPGFAGLDDEHLASLLVGRWPSGAPLLRVPMKDDPSLGAGATRQQLLSVRLRYGATQIDHTSEELSFGESRSLVRWPHISGK